VGNPLGLGTSVSTGVVSGLDRDLMRSPFDDYIQTDASINPGNSGGPLLDCSGKIIGVDTALLSNSKVLGSIGIGFAQPSNDVRFVAGRLLDPNSAMPNWIGLHLQDLTDRLATIFGRPDMGGAIVTGTDPNSPAAVASLVPGDVVTGADGQDLPDARAILRFILLQPPGEPISLSVWHRDHMANVTVQGKPWPRIMALHDDVLASAASVEQVGVEGVGVHLAAVTDADRKRLGLPQGLGVLIDQVTPGSQADSVGLKAGDVIEQMDSQPASSLQAVSARLRYDNPAPHDVVALLVKNDQGRQWLTLYVGTAAELLAATGITGGTSITQDASAPRNVSAARDASAAAPRQ
jgi:serine protease Do